MYFAQRQTKAQTRERAKVAVRRRSRQSSVSRSHARILLAAIRPIVPVVRLVASLFTLITLRDSRECVRIDFLDEVSGNAPSGVAYAESDEARSRLGLRDGDNDRRQVAVRGVRMRFDGSAKGVLEEFGNDVVDVRRYVCESSSHVSVQDKVRS